MVLCLGLLLLVFSFHAYNVKFNGPYRKLSTREKIKRAYYFLPICVWVLHFVFPIQYVLKHRAVLNPKSANILLWLISRTPGFDIILTCSTLNPYLALVVSCTYPLSILQALVVVGNCVDLNSLKNKI